MCRVGGRRCPGGASTTKQATRARQQLCRARKGLAQAEASGDRAASEQARERVQDAQDTVDAVRALAGADKPDRPNGYGLYRAERQALSEYTGGTFRAVNKYIENGYKVPDYAADDKEYAREMCRTVRALERAANRSALDTPATAVRAIHAGTAGRVYGPVGSLVGQTVTERRFTSTTKGDTPLEEFGDVTIHYDLAKGTKAIDVNASGVACKQDENELLLGPHQPFRVTSDQIVNGRRVIRMSNADIPGAVLGGSPGTHSQGDVTRADRAHASAPLNEYEKRARLWAQEALNATTEHERKRAQAEADEWARLAQQAARQSA